MLKKALILSESKSQLQILLIYIINWSLRKYSLKRILLDQFLFSTFNNFYLLI